MSPTLRRGTHWAGVGTSGAHRSFDAGAEAARAALGDPARGATLVVLFASDDHDLDALVAGTHSVVGDETQVIGCTTAGEICAAGGGGPTAGSTGLVTFALGGEGLSVRTGVAEGASANLRKAGATAAGAALEGVEGQHRVLMLLSDGLSGDQQEIVRGAYSVAGAAVRLVGGCAGDDMRMVGTRQIHGGRVYHDAVVAAAIASDAPIGIGVSHGWVPVGDPLVVTGSQGVRVRTLDDRPALDVYLERLSPPAEVAQDAAVFTRFAQTHPLGLEGRAGVSIRFVAGADFETRELVCIAQLPEGGVTQLMSGDFDSVLDATDAAAHQALSQLAGRDPVGLLAFDCIARRGILGDEGIGAEAARLAKLSGGAPVAGFYTYGEFARTHGMNGFHNQTLVVLALA